MDDMTTEELFEQYLLDLIGMMRSSENTADEKRDYPTYWRAHDVRCTLQEVLDQYKKQFHLEA